MEEVPSETSPISTNSFKLYGYRWVVITIFSLYCALNYLQFLQFSIIEDIVEKYYGVDSFYVDLTGTVFMIFYILLFIPVGHIVENTSLKTSIAISAGLTAIGNCLKLVAIEPERFYMALLAQTLCGIAEIFIVITPSKVASIWFGAEEVSTACAIGVFGSQIGVAVGTIIPTQMVKRSNNQTEVEHDLSKMFIYNATASIAIFLIILFFFRSKPPSPPSQSQTDLCKPENDTMTYGSAMKEFVRNKDFLIILFTMGIGLGLWTSSGTLINQIYVHFFPDASIHYLGYLIAITVISGGCFGSMIFGYILDKTHKFKSTTFLLLCANSFTFMAQAFFLQTKNFIGVSISLPVNGFFNGSLMVIAFEYAIETTYPIPEAFGAAILYAVINAVAILYVVVLGFIFDAGWYLQGFIIMSVSLIVATAAILLVSPELKRRNANLKSALQ